MKVKKFELLTKIIFLLFKTDEDIQRGNGKGKKSKKGKKSPQKPGPSKAPVVSLLTKH